jgi:hypothetical protein
MISCFFGLGACVINGMAVWYHGIRGVNRVLRAAGRISWSRRGSVVTVNRYWLDDEGAVVRYHAEAEVFLCTTALKIESGAPLSFLFSG